MNQVVGIVSLEGRFCKSSTKVSLSGKMKPGVAVGTISLLRHYLNWNPSSSNLLRF